MPNPPYRGYIPPNLLSFTGYELAHSIGNRFNIGVSVGANNQTNEFMRLDYGAGISTQISNYIPYLPWQNVNFGGISPDIPTMVGSGSQVFRDMEIISSGRTQESSNTPTLTVGTQYSLSNNIRLEAGASYIGGKDRMVDLTRDQKYPYETSFETVKAIHNYSLVSPFKPTDEDLQVAFKAPKAALSLGANFNTNKLEIGSNGGFAGATLATGATGTLYSDGVKLSPYIRTGITINPSENIGFHLGLQTSASQVTTTQIDEDGGKHVREANRFFRAASEENFKRRSEVFDSPTPTTTEFLNPTQNFNQFYEKQHTNSLQFDAVQAVAGVHIKLNKGMQIAVQGGLDVKPGNDQALSAEYAKKLFETDVTYSANGEASTKNKFLNITFTKTFGGGKDL